MRKLLVLAVLGALAAATVVPSLATARRRAPVRKPPVKTFLVKDYEFSPARATVRFGTILRFKWYSSDQHNVILGNRPRGAKRFATPIASGTDVSASYRPARRGSYRFFCSLHPYMITNVRVR